MKTLLVMPHLDDEAISCGGLIQARLAQGEEVIVMVVYGRVYDHGKEDGTEAEVLDFHKARELLGYDLHHLVLKREGEPHMVGYYEILAEVEEVLGRYQPDEVVGPSGADTNQDHRMLSHILDIALRPINQGEVTRRLEFLSLDGSTQDPNYFIELTPDMLELKQRAIAAYGREARTGASPRSPRNIEAQAQVWGAKSGFRYAEAYRSRLIKETAE